jgi:hypothetical protein
MLRANPHERNGVFPAGFHQNPTVACPISFLLLSSQEIAPPAVGLDPLLTEYFDGVPRQLRLARTCEHARIRDVQLTTGDVEGIRRSAESAQSLPGCRQRKSNRGSQLLAKPSWSSNGRIGQTPTEFSCNIIKRLRARLSKEE